MTMATVGPVIGKVTDTNARVLLEVDQDADVTCRATPEGSAGAAGATKKLSLKKGRPGVFALEPLQPGTTYRVAFSGATSDIPCQFATLPADTHALNIAAVSCNFVPRRGETDLWRDLYDRYASPGHVNLLLHLGDQVYGDQAFEESMHILRANAADEEAVRERYRRLYRLTWNHPSQRLVMARVPNLMIWDDHDIRDDWGGYPAHRDPNSIEGHVGRLARQVYRDYQRQLWDDSVKTHLLMAPRSTPMSSARLAFFSLTSAGRVRLNLGPRSRISASASGVPSRLSSMLRATCPRRGR